MRSKAFSKIVSRNALRTATVVLLLGGMFGCAPAAEEEAAAPAPVPVRVEIPELGLVILDLPTFFRVASNQDAHLVLEPAAADAVGRLEISADVPDVNLVEAIKEHKASIEARGGEYKGQQELMSPVLGTAFYSRGVVPGEDGASIEEVVLYTLHPDGDHRIDLVYRYPLGEDSGVRLEEHLFGIFGELEGLPVLEGS